MTAFLRLPVRQKKAYWHTFILTSGFQLAQQALSRTFTCGRLSSCLKVRLRASLSELTYSSSLRLCSVTVVWVYSIYGFWREYVVLSDFAASMLFLLVFLSATTSASRLLTAASMVWVSMLLVWVRSCSQLRKSCLFLTAKSRAACCSCMFSCVSESSVLFLSVLLVLMSASRFILSSIPLTSAQLCSRSRKDWWLMSLIYSLVLIDIVETTFFISLVRAL